MFYYFEFPFDFEHKNNRYISTCFSMLYVPFALKILYGGLVTKILFCVL
nr:MAG TPA: hypothetical protein [Bacteriophage sp.]